MPSLVGTCLARSVPALATLCLLVDAASIDCCFLAQTVQLRCHPLQAPSLTQGGMWWFSDLTVPDAYYGLPVLCTLTTLAMIQYGINITGENMDAQKAGACLLAEDLSELCWFVPGLKAAL
eukprot:1144499-Pelagomonas_calceolata.AAC.10